MRILLIGATGTIGKAIAAALGSRHEVLLASRQQAPFHVDMTDPGSIAALFAKVMEVYGRLDVLFNNAGTGAPAIPNVRRKLVWTTIIAGLVFALWYVVYTYRLIALDDLAALLGVAPR